MFTKRARTYAALRRQGFDALPWQFDLTSKMAEKLRLHYQTDDLLSAMDDHFTGVGPHAPRGFVPESVGPGLEKNEFGAVWHRDVRDRNVGDWGGLHSYPLSEPSLRGYRFPDGSAPGRWDHVPAIRQKHKDLFLVAGGCGLFESAWGLCGFENYLGYTASDPAFVEELTEKMADYSIGVTRQLKGLNVDAIRFGDDWGLQNSLMISRESWQRLFKKQYQRIYAEAHKLGLVVMIHSCGNITELVPDFIECGVEVIHAFQPEAMDVRYCQREFGKHVSFWGGLGSQSTIPLGTSEDCRREVRDRLELFKAGGYILAPAGAVPTEAPVENIVAIVDAAREQLAGCR